MLQSWYYYLSRTLVKILFSDIRYFTYKTPEEIQFEPPRELFIINIDLISLS